jgi:hypothetical protein
MSLAARLFEPLSLSGRQSVGWLSPFCPVPFSQKGWLCQQGSLSHLVDFLPAFYVLVLASEVDENAKKGTSCLGLTQILGTGKVMT